MDKMAGDMNMTGDKERISTHIIERKEQKIVCRESGCNSDTDKCSRFPTQRVFCHIR